MILKENKVAYSITLQCKSNSNKKCVCIRRGVVMGEIRGRDGLHCCSFCVYAHPPWTCLQNGLWYIGSEGFVEPAGNLSLVFMARGTNKEGREVVGEEGGR